MMSLLLLSQGAKAFDTSQLDQGGSLPLSDLAPLIASSKTLQKEVEERLGETGLKPDSVVCSGKRFPRQWSIVGGARASPYRCDFAGKQLTIQATVTLTSSDGRVYPKASRAAMKNASNISESRPKWSWTKAGQ